MASRLVAIHQPNFLPWLGYLDKIARADVFVLLDDAEFSKGSPTNRVRILINGEPRWLTVPVSRAGGSSQRIAEVEIRDGERWRQKGPETVRHAYARAPQFDEAFAFVEPLLREPADRLADYNERAIRELAGRLAPEGAEIVRSSSLDAGGRATERLAAIVAAVGGDAYLAGGGAGGYQEDERFASAGIELVRQDFRHPDYLQLADEPVHGLSVVDALMSCGFERTAEMLSGD
ncbi:MAG: WbqC family protein [Solirubrobacterales bacterium]